MTKEEALAATDKALDELDAVRHAYNEGSSTEDTTALENAERQYLKALDYYIVNFLRHERQPPHGSGIFI